MNNSRELFLEDVKDKVVSFLEVSKVAWFFNQEGFIGEDTFFYYNGYVIYCSDDLPLDEPFCFLAKDYSLSTLLKFIEMNYTISEKKLIDKVSESVKRYSPSMTSKIINKVQSLIEQKNLNNDIKPHNFIKIKDNRKI